jgi:hypothetical protein
MMNEITFLDKTSRTGVCSECVGQLTQLNHELMPIHSTIQEVKDVIMNLEVNMMNLLRDRTTLMNDNKGKL